MEYKGYKELKCYRQACALRKFISGVAKKNSFSLKILTYSQIIDSSRSMTRNMAEGYGRYTYADTRNFFIKARGSITETMENLTAAFDESYITPNEFREGEERCQLVFNSNNEPNSKFQTPKS